MPANRRRNLFAAADFAHLAGKLAGGSLAAFLPHSADPAVVSVVNGIWSRMRAAEIRTSARQIERTLPDRFDPASAQTLAEQWVARRSELYWGRMRGLYPSDWRIRLDLEGRGHLEQALTAGRGAVVWFASCCDSLIRTPLWKSLTLLSVPTVAARCVHSGSSASTKSDLVSKKQ